MRMLLTAALIASLPPSASAQSPAPQPTSTIASGDWRATVTLFRTPGTGRQKSRGHFAAFVALSTTVINRLVGFGVQF
ncbi:hypothetical protein [Gemmatimonas groenlandica]|uniref:Uncharacterized protein n=1 Tax=Gemmatimonas groenlandica TaxID=2732249 RepID=A0A6M4II20_9BACT|nr:hypothetical protein [Gemmatimonas groenlandica]QJR34260.1 hypothetical protein HKW67_01370 [Gemmatimonas groenlandica]